MKLRKLQLERLESREVMSVDVIGAVVAPSPQGDPGFQVKIIYGNPQHSPGHVVEPHGGPNRFIFVQA